MNIKEGSLGELDWELQRYVEVCDDLGMPMLRHPLVYMVPMFPGMESHANAQLSFKKDLIEKKCDIGEYSSIVAIHERPYRINAFLEYLHLMEDEVYWSTLSWMWIDSENIPQNWNAWELLLKSDRGGRENFMGERDWSAFNGLPDSFPVFQGVNESLENAHNEYESEEVSWSTSEATALFFAKRFGGSGKITSKMIQKNDVFAYLTGRNEQEIIILPGTRPALKLKQ